jgi:Tfp pilus assembly PilM family ATPase
VSSGLGIDLGAHELKIVETHGNQLVRHAEVLLPEGAISDGMPTPVFSAALRGTIEQGRFAAKKARIAIAETGTAFRDFTLPLIPQSELSSAVGFEGRRLIPMDADDVYFAWHAAREANHYGIYLVAARRGMIDAINRTVSEAGLLVDRIDLKPLALARGIGVQDGLVLEWGAVDATVVLMRAGRPRFFRTFELDSPAEELETQIDELVFSLNALVKFIRGAIPDLSLGPETPLILAGRFAFTPEGSAQAQKRFPFKIVMPSLPLVAAADFPWQAHLAGIGLLQQEDWRNRLTPSQGGDIRVAA